MPLKSRDLVGSTGSHIPVVSNLPYNIAQNHLGNGFIHSDIHLNLASSATVFHHLKTGANEAHVRFFRIITTGAPVTVAYYEDAVISADGTPLGLGCTNRVLNKTPTAAVFEAPTITDNGTLIGSNLIAAVTNQGGGSLDILADGEWVLKPNTSYLWSITNGDNAAINFETTIRIYEPDLR